LNRSGFRPRKGGGYLDEFLDLSHCMSDGETVEEAVADGEDAKRCWIAAMKRGRPANPATLGRAGRLQCGKMTASRAEIAAPSLSDLNSVGEPEHPRHHAARGRPWRALGA
jgi:predicted RNase H-like HicB family nuclease